MNAPSQRKTLRLLSLRILLVWLTSMFLTSAFADEAIREQYLPVDSDGDGVLDERDECYKTAPGVLVDEQGCKISVRELKTINLNINFDYDSYNVKPIYFSEIESIARFMKDNPLTRVIIEGHTDSDGSNAYNQLLSQRRAQAVAAVLVTQFAIKPLRVTAVGFGEEQPLVANDSAENKSKNRRVVAVINVLAEKPAKQNQ